MKTFEQFRQYFAPELFGIPATLAIRAIREAVIEFCSETRILLADAYPIPVIEETAEYEIEFDGEYEAIDIESAYYGERLNTDTRLSIVSRRSLEGVYNWHSQTSPTDPMNCLLEQSGKVRMYPIPENDSEEDLLLTCVVKPTRISTRVDDDLIYNDHIESIKHGALYRLLGMRGRTWFDIDAAADEKSLFLVDMANIRGVALQGKSSIPMTISYSGLPKC